MAVKTYRLALGNDGNFGALSESDITAANRTDGWTSAKIASPFASDFDAGTKQISSTFASDSSKPNVTFVAGGTQTNALKTPAPLTGVFANTAWTLTFALRCTVASSQRGRMRLRVFRGTSADGASATQITSVPIIGTTVAAALSTTADQTSVVTWNPGTTITLNNEYLFFSIAWEITTAGGSNSADVVMRTGQAAGGSRLVTPDFVAPITTQRSLSATMPMTAQLSSQAIVPTPISLGAPMPMVAAGTADLRRGKAILASLTLTPMLSARERDLELEISADLGLASALGLSFIPGEEPTPQILLSSSLVLTPTLTDIATHYRAISGLFILTPVLSARKRDFDLAISASLVLTPSQTRAYRGFRTLASSLILTSAVNKEPSRSLAANLALSPTLNAQRLAALFTRALSASLLLIPDVAVKTGGKQPLSASLALSATLAREISRGIPGSLNLVPILTKRATHYRALTASLPISPILAKEQAYRRALSAVLSLSAGLGVRTTHLRALNALLALTVASSDMVTRRLAAGLALNPQIRAPEGRFCTSHAPGSAFSDFRPGCILQAVGY